jgi:hypothetical protein
MKACYVILIFVSMSACTQSESVERQRANADSLAQAGAEPSRPGSLKSAGTVDSVVSDSATFAQRVVVFMEAASEDIERARAGVSEEDFAVIADDLMFYRSAAYEYLEKKQLPVVRWTGRRVVTFMADGRARQYDFSDWPTLDVIVLFDPGREPQAIAPADLHLVDAYFAASPIR